MSGVEGDTKAKANVWAFPTGFSRNAERVQLLECKDRPT